MDKKLEISLENYEKGIDNLDKDCFMSDDDEEEEEKEEEMIIEKNKKPE